MVKRKRRVHGRPERRPPAPRRRQKAAYYCEADVAAGLETLAREELFGRMGSRVRLRQASGAVQEPGVIRFTYTGDLRALLGLRTVLAVYLARHFAIPRPRAFLGDEHLRALLEQVAVVRRLWPSDTYETLYLSAAGSESSVMMRLKDELARQTRLLVATHEGDLLLRLRRPSDGRDGWEALVRLSPRPLATRSWRVSNMEGALDATVAHAMALLTRPSRRDVFLNLACGSGTLLIERLDCAPVQRAIGCDISPEALACARANLTASGHRADVDLHLCDARSLPLRDGCVDAVCADLPFGHLMGSHDENVTLYPAILHEAGRVARPDARLVLITHEVRLMETLLNQSDIWAVEEVRRVFLGGLHPRIFVLRRRSSQS